MTPERSSLRLDFVSPLPPVRSGIADYSADLLTALAPLCDLRVARLDGQEVSAEMEELYAPVGDESVGSDGRLPLYQMGNNPYHERVHELAIERPGVVTLHDIFLHHLLMERTLGRRTLEPYLEQLRQDHGWMGAAVAMPPRWGAYGATPLFALPAHRTLARSQRGVLVHSEWGAHVLHEEAGDDVAVRVIPMPMPLSEPASASDVEALRIRHGVPDGAVLLGSFGFQTPIKRTDVVVRALAEPGMESVHLLAVGEVAPQLDLDRLAREVGVRDRVHLAGYVTRPELEAAMTAADLCVNLRYPTAGETSASLLRLFAQGRPALVSDYAQFAEFPDEIVLKLAVGEDEHERLAAMLVGVLTMPGRLRDMGRAAHRLIETRHDPELAARAVIEACSELENHEPVGPEAADPPPPTTLTWGKIAGRLEVRDLEDWKDGERRRLAIELHNDGLARWLAGHRGTGGVALEIRLESGGRDHNESRPWPSLPVDLEPGGRTTVEVSLRHPLGDTKFYVEPHVLGHAGFATLGGPVFEADV